MALVLKMSAAETLKIVEGLRRVFALHRIMPCKYCHAELVCANLILIHELQILKL